MTDVTNKINIELIDFKWTDEHADFNDSLALAHLLLNDIVFINSPWWKEDLSEENKKLINVYVNCNDIFAWGCADSEDLPYSEVENLWRMWQKDPAEGASVWCIQRRGMMPQKPVYDDIKKAGIWDLDSMDLKPNGYDEARKAGKTWIESVEESKL